MYGVQMPTEQAGYGAHNAVWDAEAAGRLYFAMRGIAYTTPAARGESSASALDGHAPELAKRLKKAAAFKAWADDLTNAIHRMHSRCG